jgi:hypothetical protein
MMRKKKKKPLLKNQCWQNEWIQNKTKLGIEECYAFTTLD